MNDSKTVTNEMLYELIKEFKRDVYKRFEQQDKRMDEMQVSFTQRFDQQDARMNEMQVSFIQRFEQQDKRFEQIDQRFDQVIDLIKNEKHEREKTETKLEKIYESRDKVTVGFSRAFAGVNIILAALVAFFVSMWAK